MRVSILVAALCIIAVALLVVSFRHLKSEKYRIEKVREFTENGVSYSVIRLWYRECARCYTIIVLPDNTTRIDLVYMVHGGGFRGGRAESMLSMSWPFIKRGYAVASVEYRLCGEADWLTVLGDISEGVKTALRYLEDNGYTVSRKVYLGSSAGAVAGAVLIYDPPTADHDISKIVDAFIGLSGGYCASMRPEWRGPSDKEFCNTTVSEILPFDRIETPPPRMVPALLINGDSDRLLDKCSSKKGVNCQAACFKEYLEKNDVEVEVYIVEGGHSAPMDLLRRGDKNVLDRIDEFLGSIKA